MADLPPLQWAGDVLRNGIGPGRATAGASAGRDALSSEALAEALRHVKQVVGDARRDADLYDLLAGTRREETYQPYFSGWPGLLRPLSPTIYDLPAMIQEKYRTCQTMCFCGVFPQINRAWASIDNSLFLWRYDRSGDVPVEYGGEEQAICAVGLARPRPGVFLAAIQHVIVLCTTTEVVLLGVCPGRRPPGPPGSRPDPVGLTLQPLPLYSVPSDNVVMTRVVTSPQGRIFLGGADGHLYELHYAAADSWGRKRCTKVRLTGRLQQLLPSFLPGVLGLGSSGAVDQLVLDSERHILYCHTQAGVLQAFDLGPSGQDAVKKVAEVPDFYQAAAAATGGRDCFRNAAGEKKAAAVKHLAPISCAESSKLHLLAVTADGRRVYFTTHYLRPTYPGAYNPTGLQPQGDGSRARPLTLTAVFARQSLPMGRTAADLTRPAALEVVAAHSSGGTLLLSEAAGASGRTTKLLLAARNHTLPLASPLGMPGGGLQAGGGMRELLTELDNFVPGETCAIEGVPSSSSLGPEVLGGGRGGAEAAQDELLTQLFTSAPRFVLISTAGCVELERRRPLEVLGAVLEERQAARLRHFFEAFGAAEAASMCCAIACSTPGAMPLASVKGAVAALEEPGLVGEARLPEDVPPPVGGSDQGLGLQGQAAGGIYMGQAVNPNPEPDWSAAHRGLCLYASRLLAPVWEQRLVAQGRAGDSSLHPQLSATTLTALTERLRCLEAFIAQQLSKRQQRGSAARYSSAPLQQGGLQGLGGGYAGMGYGGGLFGGGQQEEGAGAALISAAKQAAKRQRLSHAALLEDERSARLKGLVGRCAEALGLLHLLAANNLGRLAARLDEGSRRTLAHMTFRDLVLEPGAEEVASRLISCLVTAQLEAASPAASQAAAAAGGALAGVDEVSAALQAHCASFFREDDRVFYQASAKLKAAEAASSGSEREGLVRDALCSLVRVPLAANLGQLTSQLAYLQAYQHIPDVPLAAGAAVDPEGAALRPELGPSCERAQTARQAAYACVFSTLRVLASGASNPATPAALAAGVKEADAKKPMTARERAAASQAVLSSALASSDVFFHACLYSQLIDMGDSARLLAASAPHLEAFLLTRSGCGPALATVADLLGGAVTGAAAASSLLAALPPVGPLGRQQVSLAELLAKLYIGRRQYREAAVVYAALGLRRAGPGEAGVQLDGRVSSLQSAVLQAKSAGDSGLVDKLEQDARLMALQADVAARLAASAATGGQDASEASRRLAELQAGLRDVSELYNDYAQPGKMWDVCLQLVDFAGGAVEPALVRQLWDHALLAAWEGGQGQGQGQGQARQGGQGPGGQGAQLVAAGAVVERLGAQFYPNEASLPLPHCAFRLLQLATGLWPALQGPGTDFGPSSGHQQQQQQAGGDAVAAALVGACRGSLPAAQRVLELLLSRRAPGVPEASLASLSIRTAVLAALSSLVYSMQSELSSALTLPGFSSLAQRGQAGPGQPLSSAQREARGLVDACDRYALEARRVGSPGSEVLAEAFEAVKYSLLAQLQAGHSR